MRRMCRTLVEISPKCILRHKLATSTLEDLAEGHFHTVIGDEQLDPKQVKRVILCSGKVYYHLLEERKIGRASCRERVESPEAAGRVRRETTETQRHTT